MDQQEDPKSTPSASAEEQELEPYLKLLKDLKNQPFNRSTTETLINHPYIQAAKDGRLTLPQRHAFCVEQLAIQRIDATSFARLAGHHDFSARSLIDTVVPDPVRRHDDLFQFLLSGEVYAANLLVDHAKSLQLTSEKDIEHCRPLTAKGQAYPSYWSRLAIDASHGDRTKTKNRGVAAAAVAVNFPAWGQTCSELLKALSTRPEYGYTSMKEGDRDKSLAFIRFFATPIEGLDIMAARILKEESINTTIDEGLLTPVRLLQEYEVMFWDACYDAK